jgi:hypothetical protein
MAGYRIHKGALESCPYAVHTSICSRTTERVRIFFIVVAFAFYVKVFTCVKSYAVPIFKAIPFDLDTVKEFNVCLISLKDILVISKLFELFF